MVLIPEAIVTQNKQNVGIAGEVSNQDAGIKRDRALLGGRTLTNVKFCILNESEVAVNR